MFYHDLPMHLVHFVYLIVICALLFMPQVLLMFPRLQPLVAAMGWDLLPGNTSARRKLMQLLWISKSQAIRLEESSLYGSQSDEVILISRMLLCFMFLDYSFC